jgi:hypothetical protein
VILSGGTTPREVPEQFINRLRSGRRSRSTEIKNFSRSWQAFKELPPMCRCLDQDVRDTLKNGWHEITLGKRKENGRSKGKE